MGLSRIDTAEEVISEVENKSEESIHMGQKHGERQKIQYTKEIKTYEIQWKQGVSLYFPYYDCEILFKKERKEEIGREDIWRDST